MARAIELLEIINNAIRELDDLKAAVRDFENQDWQLDKVEYHPQEDEIFFYCKEVKDEPNYRDKG